MGLRHVKVESRDLPIAVVREPVLASRTRMDEGKLEELVESIRQQGVIEPLIVFPVDDEYEVAAGHRRRLAAARAGLVVVPCRVYASSAEAMEQAKFAENAFREDLTPAAEAAYFAQLLERDCGGDTDRLCGQLGLSRGYVEGLLVLLRGDDRILEALDSGAVSKGAATALNQCTDQLHRRMLLHEAIARGATVALVESWVADWRNVHEPATRKLQGDVAPTAQPMQLKDDFMTCRVCQESDNRHVMRPLMVHEACIVAVLDKALGMWNRRHEFTAWPRTTDEAAELINQLVDRFPALAGE